MQYHDDNIIRGYASTSAGWRDANARLPSGRWVHYALSYDGSDIRLYFDGKIVSEASHSGYLAWGDGGDHNLYLNRYSSAGWEGKAVYDDLRLYNRSLTPSEVGLLWSYGAGDLGLSPLISGGDPFYSIPSPHTVSFIENNQTASVAGLLQSEINATNGSIVSFNSGDYSFDLNVSETPTTVRIEIPNGAVVEDGNLSTAGAFEFRRRIITSVEDDLLAWYPMDDFNGSKIYDMSGRMRHGTYLGFDATSPGQGNVTASASSNTYNAAGHLMMVEIQVLRDGWLRGISCQMFGFLMILLNLLKSLTILSSHRVGDTKKELQRIGPCRVPMIIPHGLIIDI